MSKRTWSTYWPPGKLKPRTYSPLSPAVPSSKPLAQATAPEAPSPETPSAASLRAAQEAVTDPGTLDTLARFFARDGQVSRAAAPEIEGRAVPVHTLTAEFVSGKRGAPVAELEYLASKAVSADGQKASVWTAKTRGTWQVVNIATGDDEIRYAARGERKAPGGTVFHEPQIDAWYVQRGDRVLPLDGDARDAVGERGTSLGAYQRRVHDAYGGKLPGSGYDRDGRAGGYAPRSQPHSAPDPSPAPVTEDSAAFPVNAVSAVGAGAVALGVAAAGVLGIRRLRRA